MCPATGEVQVTASKDHRKKKAPSKRRARGQVDSRCRAAGDKGCVPLPSMQVAASKAKAEHPHKGFSRPVCAPAPCLGPPCNQLTTSSMPACTKGSVALHTQGTDLQSSQSGGEALG